MANRTKIYEEGRRRHQYFYIYGMKEKLQQPRISTNAETPSQYLFHNSASLSFYKF